MCDRNVKFECIMSEFCTFDSEVFREKCAKFQTEILSDNNL